MNEVNIIKTLNNEEDGIRVYVTLGHTGKFHVSMEDTDAGEFVPMVKIFPEVERAVAYAETLV